MFDFIFKRRSNTSPQIQVQQSLQVQQAQQAEKQADKQQQINHQRKTVLEKIAQSANDEAALLALLLSCDFADGRLQAAVGIHTQSALTKAIAAVRNSDKRVAKLLQSRLDALALSVQQRARAQALIVLVQQLAAASPLVANQIVELDKQRAQLTIFPDDLLSDFDAQRLKLESRLQAQTALQRRVLDVIARLAPAHPQTEESLAQRTQEFASAMQESEASAVPQSLQKEFALKLERAHIALTAQKSAPAPAPELVDVALETQNQTDNATASADAADQAPASQLKVDKPKPAQLNPFRKEQILKAIQGIEDALEQGTVLVAQNFDRELRGVDARAAGLSNEQKERLLRVRSELAHLQGWAKWGGNISRDELIKAAEQLPQKQLPVAELASKVKGLRERWKSLEASAGSVPKEVWERFDLACTNAYAPAAAHFQQLAQERQENLEKLDALVAAFRAQAPQFLVEMPDWKAISLTLQEFKQARQKVGHVERKHMTRVAQEFDAAYAILSEPLRARQTAALSEREALLQEVLAISADQRNILEQVRALQARWQSQAQTLPLRRSDEQALWEKFRAACDGLFAQRRAASEVLDAQRKENLTAKESICVKLEQSASTTQNVAEHAVNQLLQETTSEWRAIGFVERDVEAHIEQRYQAAVSQVKHALQKSRDAQAQQSKALIEQKLHLIAKLDIELILANAAAAQAINEEWQALVQSTSKSLLKINVSLNARFERALAALRDADASYIQQAAGNTASVDEKLLQLEVRHGIDSPVELAQARLQAQVAALRSSLKSGSSGGAEDQLRELLSLPSVWSDVQRSRLFRLVSNVL